MKKPFLFLALFFLFNCPVLAEREIKFDSGNSPLLLVNQDYPLVYKPTKIILGQNASFMIKAAPGSYAALLFSDSDSGIVFNNQRLRLGSVLITKNGIIPDKGLLELNLNLADSKKFKDNILYFEVIIGKDKDFTDAKVARIMAPGGRETTKNNLTISLPVDDPKKPSFTPVLPGSPFEILKTMEAIDKIQKGEPEEYASQTGKYSQTPVILRNINAPELQK